MWDADSEDAKCCTYTTYLILVRTAGGRWWCDPQLPLVSEAQSTWAPRSPGLTSARTGCPCRREILGTEESLPQTRRPHAPQHAAATVGQRLAPNYVSLLSAQRLLLRSTRERWRSGASRRPSGPAQLRAAFLPTHGCSSLNVPLATLAPAGAGAGAAPKGTEPAEGWGATQTLLLRRGSRGAR